MVQVVDPKLSASYTWNSAPPAPYSPKYRRHGYYAILMALTVLSVILPVKNGIPHIHAAIDSILNQRCTDFELIIVDNCSTDQTLDGVRSFHDPRIRIIQESRAGGPVAFNTGLKVASGDYIARMDADDVALPDRFARQIHYLETHSDISILGTQAYKINDMGETIGRSIVPQTPAAIRLASRYAAPFVHPTLMFRRIVWATLRGYREFSPGADYDMLLRALESGFRVANLPDFLLKYRIRVDSVSHRNRQHTIIHSLSVKKMHRLRREGRYTVERAILDKLLRDSARRSRWFETLDNHIDRLTWFRNRCALKNRHDPRIIVSNISIAAISSFHPHMAIALWSAFRLKMIIARHRRPHFDTR